MIRPPCGIASLIRSPAWRPAAVPSDGILNSTSTSASSRSACSHPFRAIVQKSAALLVTKATFFEAPPGREQAKIVSPRNPHKHVSATRENLMLFSFILPRPWERTHPACRVLYTPSMLEGCAPLTYFRARSLGAHPSCVP